MIVNYLFAENIISLLILFFLLAISLLLFQQEYISTEYPRMPVDGLMFSLATFLHTDIKKARLIIEFIGFIIMILAHGKFDVGPVIMTITCGYVFAMCKSLLKKCY